MVRRLEKERREREERARNQRDFEAELEKNMQAKLKEDRNVKDNALLAEQQQRRQEVMERVQRMKEEREQKRRELHDHAKQVLGRHKKGSPMYKELEKQFKEQVEIEDLETKKKRLQLIRDMHRPLDHQDLS